MAANCVELAGMFGLCTSPSRGHSFSHLDAGRGIDPPRDCFEKTP